MSSTPAAECSDGESEPGMVAAYSMTDLLDGLDDEDDANKPNPDDVDDSNMLDPDIESSVETSVGSVVKVPGHRAAKDDGKAENGVSTAPDSSGMDDSKDDSFEDAVEEQSDDPAKQSKDLTKTAEIGSKSVSSNGEKVKVAQGKQSGEENKNLKTKEDKIGEEKEKKGVKNVEENANKKGDNSGKENAKKKEEKSGEENVKKKEHKSGEEKAKKKGDNSGEENVKKKEDKSGKESAKKEEDKGVKENAKKKQDETGKENESAKIKENKSGVENANAKTKEDKSGKENVKNDSKRKADDIKEPIVTGYEEVVVQSEDKKASVKALEEEKNAKMLEDSIEIIVENDVYESADAVRPSPERSVPVPPRDVYESAAVVRDRKRESVSPGKESQTSDYELEQLVKVDNSRESSVDSTHSGNMRITSDIGGRFHVESTEFSGTKENIYYNDADGNIPKSESQHSNVSSDHYEAYYNDISAKDGKSTTKSRRFRDFETRAVCGSDPFPESPGVADILPSASKVSSVVVEDYSKRELEKGELMLDYDDRSYEEEDWKKEEWKPTSNTLNDPWRAGSNTPSEATNQDAQQSHVLPAANEQARPDHMTSEATIQDAQQMIPAANEQAEPDHMTFEEANGDEDPDHVISSFVVVDPLYVDVALDDDENDEGNGSDDTLKDELGTFSGTLRSDEIYENIGGGGAGTEESYGDDGGWSSSEFESYDEDEEADVDSDKREAVKRKRKKSDSSESAQKERRSMRSSVSPEIQLPNMLDKIAARLGQKGKKDEDEMDEESMLVEVILSAEKHPPPSLPPTPAGLTTLQTKRRHIVSSIVDSEVSYVSSLRRIIEEYEKPLLEAKPHILSKTTIKVIFYKVRDILQCHNMFQIELAEAIRVWDENETIGNVFTASFSKSVVFDAYSAFVNNFSVAMETARKQARTKQGFAEFIKQCLVDSRDKLSLFGLMVKPVQRFPQFIMLIQDLLKQTPTNHGDRLPLQMALSELEALTYKLNETKRESENRYDVKKILGSMTGRPTVKADQNRYLVRQDDMTQVEKINGETKTKVRRMFLLNDQLLCCTVIQRDESGMAEKYKFKWSAPVKEVEVVEAPIQPNYQVFSGNGKVTIKSLKASNIEVSEHNPYRKELDDMLHDLPLVEQMQQLVSQLRLKYQGLDTDLFSGVIRTLQIHVQQKSDIDKCIIQLGIPVKYVHPERTKIKEEMHRASKHIKKLHDSSSSPKTTGIPRGSVRQTFVFQVSAPGIKQDWLRELNNIKLSLDPRNHPGWQLPESELQFTSRLPLFFKPLLVSITNFHLPEPKKTLTIKKKKYNMKVQCCTAVVLPSPDLPGVGIQHLWVISGDKGRSQVAVTSVIGNQPRVTEAFTACDELVFCAETVPGTSSTDESKVEKYAFHGSTVWMGTDDHNIHIFYVEEDLRKESCYKVSLDAKVLCIRYLDHRVYAGLKNGTLVIFSRDRGNGTWNFKTKTVVKLGKEPISCLLTIGHEMWVAMSHHVWAITMTTTGTAKKQHDANTVCHEVGSSSDGPIKCLVKAGVGLLVSFANLAVIRLYHLETMEHLQDISIKSGVSALLDGHKLSADLAAAHVSLHITFLLSSKGLLWIGTNVGVVMTLPLPRLEGVPQMKGRPTISHHAHNGPVTFLSAVHCGICPLHVSAPPSLETSVEYGAMSSAEEAGKTSSDHLADDISRMEDYRLTQSADYGMMNREDDVGVEETFPQLAGTPLSSSIRSRWNSTPDIREMEMYESECEDVKYLYGSLMQGLDEDFELYDGNKKRKSQNFRAKATAFNARITQTVSKLTGTPMSPSQKYATLPILSEDQTNGGAALRSVPEHDVESAEVAQSFSVSDSHDDTSSYTSSSHDQTSVEVERSQESNGPLRQNILRPEQPPIGSIPQHSAMLSQQAMGKSSLIVSGGAGHIDWGKGNVNDLKYDDMCLLLWQCRV